MQLKAKEPINGGFAASGEVVKDAMLGNPTIVADFKARDCFKTKSIVVWKLKSA